MNLRNSFSFFRFRIPVLATVLVLTVVVCRPPKLGAATIEETDRPNVILMMSDDQGCGDYGFVGNQIIKTPHLDAMHSRSGYLSNFYVSPVCAPTRASLMTGRYNYRTRCVDTYIGRAMMDTDEITIAELLRDAGYKTGIYGKWHLGDNYPLRPMDQGFQDSLVHRGGGIGQPSDPIGAEKKYTDPTLFRNGRAESIKGYCTDIYFDEAINFITTQAESGENFFAYIATNAPHGPFHDVPADLYQQYKDTDFSPIVINPLNPKRRPADFDKLARIASMITNIDDNVGRLFTKLDALGVTENTIVIYLNDNGPNSRRFVGDMRGMKTNVDDGGIRSPLIFHWPAKLSAKNVSDQLCAHIDVLPTILDACGIATPEHHRLDGRSFLPILTDPKIEWPTRQVVFQAHRGDKPQPYHNFALHESPWKLVNPSGFGKEKFAGEPKLQLYNLSDDPRQENDLAAENPEVLARLTSAYDDWFADVSSTRPDNYAPPRIVIGTKHETETVLTRQDWRHTRKQPWAADSNGHWLLEAKSAGDYNIELIFASDQISAGTAKISAGKDLANLNITASQQRGHCVTMKLPAGKFLLTANVNFDGAIQGPHQIVLTQVPK